MYNKINCADYYIIKVRFYADKSVLKKYYADKDHSNKPYPSQHQERAEQYNLFYQSFVEKVTGIKYEKYIDKFFLSTKECTTELLYEKYGIEISTTDGWYIYFIPKINNKELFDWFITNCNLPYKILKKTFIGWWNEPTTWMREQACASLTKDFYEKINYPKEKWNDIYNI